MRIDTIKDASTEVLAKKAATALSKQLSLQKDGFCLLFSGGSALSILTILCDVVDLKLFGKKCTVGVLDERYSSDPQINNFAQLTQTSCYKKIVSSGATIIDTRIINNESAAQLADRFYKSLSEIKVPIIATVGIGPDGHTSGIMPFPENPQKFAELFENKDKLIVEYDATGKNPFTHRVTTTLPLMRKIRYAVGIVTGEEKHSALQRIRAEAGSLAETPARILNEMENVDIFTNINLK